MNKDWPRFSGPIQVVQVWSSLGAQHVFYFWFRVYWLIPQFPQVKFESHFSFFFRIFARLILSQKLRRERVWKPSFHRGSIEVFGNVSFDCSHRMGFVYSWKLHDMGFVKLRGNAAQWPSRGQKYILTFLMTNRVRVCFKLGIWALWDHICPACFLLRCLIFCLLSMYNVELLLL